MAACALLRRIACGASAQRHITRGGGLHARAFGSSDQGSLKNVVGAPAIVGHLDDHKGEAVQPSGDAEEAVAVKTTAAAASSPQPDDTPSAPTGSASATTAAESGKGNADAAPPPPPQHVHHVQAHVHNTLPKMTVIGVGGAGGNALNNMIDKGLRGVEFLACNTDAQHLQTARSERRLQLGKNVTKGLGCGANPDLGREAASESREELMSLVDGSNMVFVTAGMGGGTGTGAAPVIAQACMDAGILTAAVVTKPFRFEGSHRMRLAQEGLGYLQDCTDTLIVVPNQNLFQMVEKHTTLADAFRLADDVLLSGVRSVTDLMTTPGLINLDFADVHAIMLGMGTAMMGTGEASGDDRALRAAEDALNNPLLGDMSIKSAKGLLVNIAGGGDLTLHEVDEAATRVTDEVEDKAANIIFGSTYDGDLTGGHMRVSVVATGIEHDVTGP